MRKTSWVLLLVIVAAAAASVFVYGRKKPKDKLPAKVDFNVHIRPILSDRCFKCHGPDAKQRKGNLRLDIPDSAFAALKESPGLFAIVPGRPEASQVYHRIISPDTAERMPPPSSNLVLSDLEIRLIEKWIKQGAEYKPHWAFIKPHPQQIPDAENKEWPRNEIDHFILAKMESIGLSPNEQADKERLLKRVCFDLTGLPATIEMQDKFLNDNSANAYEKIIDELLASKHYGEKLAVHWLDVSRYADSHGYQDDGLRTMWPWRDWVIHAFNENYSYEKFVTWQLAGDLLPNPSKEMLLATGFNRNHKITQEGGVIDEEYRLEYVTDRTNTFGKAFLAMTFECAKCHDHKFDPIPQRSYYSTFAFFNQINEKGLLGDITLASLADPPKMKISTNEVKNILQFINKEDTADVEVMIMKDSSKTRPTHILKRGVYDQLGDSVSFNTPPKIFPFDSVRFDKNRLGLSKWLFDKNHPLTARVFVNRIWQELFGRGLVKTSGDFGMQGEPPSHPELLDWLALDFMSNGWDIKRLVKQIVMSATYCQSSVVTKQKLSKDPDNIYLSRSPRARYAAEFVKDLVLASSGLMNYEIGGPSVKTYQPKGIWESSTSGRGQLARYIQDHDDKLYRRGMYTFIKRTAPPPSMLTFDGSNRDQCEVKRVRTNTPLQALVLLNDPQVLEAARVLAERLSTENISDEQKIEKAFRLIVSRRATEKEKKILFEYYKKEKEEFSKQAAKAESFLKAGEYKHEEKINKIAAAALMQVVHTIYNMEEAITKT
ncbi:MAG TPA: PSD1 and planctomycete cytochrome C domain-containing protein [Chitinophagaceae bacterium]|nr:PSD1 and planctomycete cytochrome C domain-containing protein [Chitinophagaceae bacterium]